MVDYEHTQPGTLMRTVFGSVVMISGGAAGWTATHDPAGAFVPVLITLVLLTCLFVFHDLTVQVTKECIALRFGVGLVRKRFAMADIQKAVTVRNHWYYGWGIKYTPHGWLYNVSGFAAVEIQLSTGRKYRIGTNEPDKLCQAIESAVAGTGSDNTQSVSPGGESRKQEYTYGQ